MFDQLIEPPTSTKYAAAVSFFMSLKAPAEVEKTANLGAAMGGPQRAARQTLRGMVPTNTFMAPPRSAMKAISTPSK